MLSLRAAAARGAALRARLARGHKGAVGGIVLCGGAGGQVLVWRAHAPQRGRKRGRDLGGKEARHLLGGRIATDARAARAGATVAPAEGRLRRGRGPGGRGRGREARAGLERRRSGGGRGESQCSGRSAAPTAGVDRARARVRAVRARRSGRDPQQDLLLLAALPLGGGGASGDGEVAS